MANFKKSKLEVLEIPTSAMPDVDYVTLLLWLQPY